MSQISGVEPPDLPIITSGGTYFNVGATCVNLLLLANRFKMGPALLRQEQSHSADSTIVGLKGGLVVQMGRTYSN